MKPYKLIIITVFLATLLFSGCTKEKPSDVNKNPAPSEVTQKEDITLYVPNEMVDGFDTKEINIALDAQGIVDSLIAENALPKETKVKNFTLEEDNAKYDDLITLDVSKEFGDSVSSMGTAGELMLMGSLVNTFLDAYDADFLNLTCEGEVISTGHNVYDYPLSFYDLKSNADDTDLQD